MANKLNRVDQKKWIGVYAYQSDTKKIKGKPDQCFYITFKVDGRKVTEKIGWKSEGYTPQIAAEERAKRVRHARHGKAVKTSKEIRKEKTAHSKTIDELKTAYFESDRGLNLKGRKTDINRYDTHIKKLFGNRRADSLSPFDIDRLKGSMKGHAPATVANALEMLRRIINYGIKNNLCPPLSFTIELPKRDNEVTEYLTPEEARRLMDVLETWPSQDVANMLKLAWLTGMRRGEIFKLQGQDIDFQQNFITLRAPKGNRTMTIPISEAVIKLLKKQIEWREEYYPGSSYVFPGKKGGRRTDCSAVNRIKTEAKLPKSFRIFHGLRHHMAVTLASSGEFTIDMIGSLLTHKSHSMTMRYANFLPDAKKKAAERAADLLQRHVSRKIRKVAK